MILRHDARFMSESKGSFAMSAEALREAFDDFNERHAESDSSRHRTAVAEDVLSVHMSSARCTSTRARAAPSSHSTEAVLPFAPSSLRRRREPHRMVRAPVRGLVDLDLAACAAFLARLDLVAIVDSRS